MTEGYRKAALKLHSLSILDQTWMLQRLPAYERAQLTGLLQELQELGIKTDQRIADHISSDEVKQSLLKTGSGVPGLSDALDAMCAARPAEISALLSSEPDNMVAVVLSAYAWPWRAVLLADYGVEKRQRISRALQQTPQLRPRLRAEMVKILAGRLVVQHTENPVFDDIVVRNPRRDNQPVMGTFFQGLRRWLS